MVGYAGTYCKKCTENVETNYKHEGGMIIHTCKQCGRVVSSKLDR